MDAESMTSPASFDPVALSPAARSTVALPTLSFDALVRRSHSSRSRSRRRVMMLVTEFHSRGLQMTRAHFHTVSCAKRRHGWMRGEKYNPIAILTASITFIAFMAFMPFMAFIAFVAFIAFSVIMIALVAFDSRRELKVTRNK